MRIHEVEVTFSSYLLGVDDGDEKIHANIGEDMIQVPQVYLVKTLDGLIEKDFPHINKFYPDKYFVLRWAILTTRNENVNITNEQIMETFPSSGTTYRSVDTIAEGDL